MKNFQSLIMKPNEMESTEIATNTNHIVRLVFLIGYQKLSLNRDKAKKKSIKTKKAFLSPFYLYIWVFYCSVEKSHYTKGAMPSETLRTIITHTKATDEVSFIYVFYVMYMWPY